MIQYPHQQRPSVPYRLLLAVLGLTTAVMLTGCARAVVTTTVHPDGSFTRNVKYYGFGGGGDTGGILGMASMFGGMGDDASKPAHGTGKNKTGATKPDTSGGMDKAMGAMMNADASFLLPHGAPWTVSRSKQDGQSVYTAEQQVAAAGMLSGDIAVKDIGDAKQPLTSNTVTVRQLAPSRFEYREVIHWTGPPASSDTPDKDLIVSIKRALPAGLGIDANAIPLAKAFDRDLTQCMVGPPEPMIADMMEFLMLPDLMERKIFRAMGASFMDDIRQQLGDRMTREQQVKLAKAILHDQIGSISNQVKSNSPAGGGGGQSKGGTSGLFDFGGHDNKSANLSGLTFSTYLPGKVVETNGEYNPATGEVYWCLYALAAQGKDVVLTATCDTSQ
jgi:hypothetical protein